MDSNGQLTPSRTSELLKEIDHEPVKKLGQNFLVDSNIVRKSLELAEVSEGEYVVEVGPGLGTLTGALLERGAKVFAVELDKKLFGYISRTFQNNANLNIINADAVDFPRAALPKDTQDFKIVANLPYAISTPWLDEILSGNLPKAMSLMLQKEAAQRFVAAKDSKEFSPISIFLNCAYKVKTMHKVSASCFYPRPKVDSALLALERLENPYIFEAQTKSIIRKIFSRRRKQISSIVKDLDDSCAKMWLENSSEIPPNARPDTIELNSWIALNEIIKNNNVK